MSGSRSFYIWLLQFVLLLSLVIFLLWLSLRLKKPTYTVIDLDIPAMRNTTVYIIDSTTTINFDLEILNPNKNAGIYYDDMNMTLYYGDQSAGDPMTINGFYQGHRKKATRRQSIRVNPQLWEAVMQAVRNGTAQLRVGLLTRVRYKVVGVKGRRQRVEVHGQMPVGPDGKISGKRKRIKLHHGQGRWRSRISANHGHG